MITRQLKDTDAEAVSELVIRCLTEINSKYYSKEVIKSMVHFYNPENIIKIAKERLVLVAENMNEEIVGTATFSKNIFGSVFVNPDNQHQGIGAKLMSSLETLAKAYGASEVKLHASINAVDFYVKQGYSKGKMVHDEKFGQSFEMTKKI